MAEKKAQQMNEVRKTGAIAVLGGGIAGIQSALDIANSGFKVYLVEEQPYVGGVMSQLDKTFPTNDCSSCMMGPKLVELAHHRNIEILTKTSVEKLEGIPGHFTLSVKRHPRYVLEDKCTGCGECAEKCPTVVPDVYNMGLSKAKAIHKYYAQSIPSAYNIDASKCRNFQPGKKCGVCSKICQAGAIDYKQEEKLVDLQVGAIILAIGYGPFDALRAPQYGYGRTPNVVTSLEFERFLSATGPTQGRLYRPSELAVQARVPGMEKALQKHQRELEKYVKTYGMSSDEFIEKYSRGELSGDHYDEWARQWRAHLLLKGELEKAKERVESMETARRIAWIQCVGSRDNAIGRDYCSYVCCMYATKQAMIAKEHDAGIETAIFYIDLRAQGKGFDRFYERARDETGVRYVRSMISRIVPLPETDRLLISYSDENNVMREEEFDMVVLSVGLCAHPSTVELAGRLGIEPDPFAFIRTGPMDMVSASRPGIYVCGAAQGPKDIPDSVQQGSSAAACATGLVAGVRGSMIEPPARYEERDVRGEKPRIGVFVCHCGINIAGVVDTEAVAEYAKTLPGVEYVFSPMFACSTDQQKEIKRAIGEHKLNRFVVASCTPRTHEPLFRNTLREAGLNPYLFELANIREHDSWVHQAEHERATEKAKDLVRMAVARVGLLEPIYDFSCEVVQKALIIGGGLAGLTAALAVAEQGFPAVLVEKTSELGGNAKKLFFTEDGGEPSKYVDDLIKAAESSELIKIYREAEVLGIKGSCGAFSTRIGVGGEVVEASHGVTIIATGGCEYKPAEYLYGQNGRVVTQKEFELMLSKGPACVQGFRNVTMIQCVGSREPENSYCSRVCCTAAVKNSLKLKEINPAANVSVLYRDIRTFGMKELQYGEARRLGVRFFRFDEDRKPEAEIGDAGLDLYVFDSQLKRRILLKTDLLVLSAAIRPGEDSKKLAETLRLPLDQDGFFLEAHPKLRPLDFTTPGFFLCGLAQGPKFANESILQARGAVSRAMTILSRKEIVAEGVVTEVDPSLCRACGECEQACLFDAIKVTEVENGKKRAVVNRALCTGCGACNGACPTGAASLAHFRDSQIEAMIEACRKISNPV